MNSFANIGKAVLIQALGIQKNYTEEIVSYEEIQDFSNASCLNCKSHAIIDNFDKNSSAYKSAISSCMTCPNHATCSIPVTKKIYHNEKNRYGSLASLKSNAIKLFIALHFEAPTKNGLIKAADLANISDILGCNIRTIWNNLEILEKYNYISFSKLDYYHANIMLNNYEDYYLSAKQGGRGFIVMSNILFAKLCDIKEINFLRIHLRELINIDSSNYNGLISIENQSMTEVRRFLPSYCKPSIVKKVVTKKSDIFDINLNNNVIRFEIRPDFIAKVQKDKLHEEYSKKLNEFLVSFNNTVPYINNSCEVPEQFVDFFDPTALNSIHNYYRLILLDELAINQLANIAVYHSFDKIIDALSTIYKDYILRNREIHNIAGLVTSIIKLDYVKAA